MSDTLDRQSGEDLKYVEDLMRQLYAAELDRKDKILASMTVVTGPLAILFAGVAFLANSLSETSAGPAGSSTDVMVVLYGAAILLLLVFLTRALFWFRRLVGSEDYGYLPDAEALLHNTSELKAYAETYGMTEDGAVAELARRNLVRLYAQAATKNRLSNDRRLAYRQGVFNNTVYALACAGVGCVVVALHRQMPHIFDLAPVWSGIHG